MLNAQELETSPLFRNITYEEYRRMLTCFQAVQRSYLAEELIYDFSASRTDAIGIVERGSAALIRIDEEGVSTVLEEMGSGGVFGRMPRGTTFADAEQQGVKFFDFLGVKTLEEARALNAELIRDKCTAFRGFFGTVSDGKFQLDNASNNLMRGKRLRVPLLVTRTTDEFKSGLRAASMDEFKQKAAERFGDRAGEFLSLCGDDLEKAVQASMTSGIEIAARSLQHRDEELGIDLPMYYGVFDAEIPGWDHPGTFHSVDLWFFFETLAKCWRPFVGKHYDLARQMCNYWANFAKTGDPNGYDADGVPMPQWRPFTLEDPCTMYFKDQVYSDNKPFDGKTRYLVDKNLAEYRY